MSSTKKIHITHPTVRVIAGLASQFTTRKGEKMPQSYIISDFKPGDFKDIQGNTWCEVAFDGVSEPARWAMRPESVSKYSVGTEVWGHLEDATSKAGKPYLRFKTDKREEVTQHATPNTEKAPWVPREDHHEEIKAQWAIGQAIAFSGNETPIKDIEATAKTFYDMVQKVKGGTLTTQSVQEAFKDVVVEPMDEPFDINSIPF
jgi:hypothetical protein